MAVGDWFPRLAGTIRSTFSIGPKTIRATIDAISLTAARTFALPDEAGTLALIGSTGLRIVALQTSNYTAAAGDSIPVDSSGGIFTITLPATPVFKNIVEVFDATGNCGTNIVTVARNGSKINGATSNWSIDIDRGGVLLMYINSAQGWVQRTRMLG